jgi:hypothetical protein
LFHLVLESHDGRALPPIPERSMSPRATSKLWWCIVSKALDLKRPIREADIGWPAAGSIRFAVDTVITVNQHFDELSCFE